MSPLTTFMSSLSTALPIIVTSHLGWYPPDRPEVLSHCMFQGHFLIIRALNICLTVLVFLGGKCWFTITHLAQSSCQNLVCSCYWVVRVPYVFWVQTPIFSHYPRVVALLRGCLFIRCSSSGHIYISFLSFHEIIARSVPGRSPYTCLWPQVLCLGV